jgi:hexosaminidase
MENRNPLLNIIPKPFSVEIGDREFSFSKKIQINHDHSNLELSRINQYLTDQLSQLTWIENGQPADSDIDYIQDIHLRLEPNNLNLDAEGYKLRIDHQGIEICALLPIGVFWGVQTFLQIVNDCQDRQDGLRIPEAEVIDQPRYPWRGVMLDVARHFFPPSDVKQIIDILAYYKINRLHLHLTDDQGWRIEIKSWPNLTAIGASTQVGGGRGGYYSQKEYSDLVAYAQSRFITIVPEIDLPGHTNAALASYPELNCDGKSPELYTGMEVGFSSLCIDKPITNQFVEDVISELASLTPGAYLHIGGDEAKSTKPEAYRRFIADVQKIVINQGKNMVGWQEISQGVLSPGSIVQYWTDQSELGKLPLGVKLLMSPAKKCYMDMKYNQNCELGLEWAGYVNLHDAYCWDPGTYLDTVKDDQIIGIEAPLWSETLETMADIEYMMFPRLLGYSEVGWSENSAKDFADYRHRLAAHGRQLETLGINYYRSEWVEWQ